MQIAFVFLCVHFAVQPEYTNVYYLKNYNKNVTLNGASCFTIIFDTMKKKQEDGFFTRDFSFLVGKNVIG